MNKLPYLWDYDIDEATFEEILAGRKTLGRLVETRGYVPAPPSVGRSRPRQS